ncbi:hypothetical protein CK203_109523 [Vitis vinifera]|uniref:Uncharacterized protein n=1 Tax=Vitis vinifera TaxID=29760 RepID=A0A438EA52_VITVI|nr:hypothetical protein CK203_109523 [Vitis vinifera]
MASELSELEKEVVSEGRKSTRGLFQEALKCFSSEWFLNVTPYRILGGEAQMVQIMLKPQEKIIAKPGSTCYMSGSTQMENVYISKNEVGMWQWAFGKAAASVVLLNQGSGDGFVGIVAPSLAKIFPIDSAMFDGKRAARLFLREKNLCGRVGQASMAFLVLDGREMMVDECKWSFQEENFKE